MLFCKKKDKRENCNLVKEKSQFNAIWNRKIANLKFINEEFSIHFQEVFSFVLLSFHFNNCKRKRKKRKFFKSPRTRERKKKKEIKARSSFKSHCCSIADLNSELKKQECGKSEKEKERKLHEMPSRITFHSRFCLLLYSNSGAVRAKTNNVFHPRASRKIVHERRKKLLPRRRSFFLESLSLCAYLVITIRRWQGRTNNQKVYWNFIGIVFHKTEQVANKTERQTFIEKRFRVVIKYATSNYCPPPAFDFTHANPSCLIIPIKWQTHDIHYHYIFVDMLFCYHLSSKIWVRSIKRA